MNLKNSVFLFVMLISLFSCGGDGGDDTLVVSGPSNLVFEANIVGQDEIHPNGDGSGDITLNFSADNTTIYKVDLGNGETKETSANELTYTYSGAGIKTFEIKIYAYNGLEFISANTSVTVQIGNGPSNLVFEANIVGKDETHPNGDGSGTITLNFSADNATFYKINMGDGEPEQSTSLNELTYTYTEAGLKTFDISISAYNGDDFIASTISVTVQIGASNGWNLIWADEFNGSGAINSSNWFHQTQLPGGGSWYNGEVQHYTNRTDNSYVSDGTLKIVAKKESFTDQGHTKQYTSARLNSKFAFTYGRIEVSAKLPTGSGTWPAIWMLGKNINEDGGYWDANYGTTGWPACGEIDIMEHWGRNQNFVQSAMHTPSSYGGTINHDGQEISTASTEFHTYALEWTEEEMIFSVDDVVHYTYNPTPKDSSTWPFDADQYILLNIALEQGIDSNFTESSMEIDYVRVYQ